MNDLSPKHLMKLSDISLAFMFLCKDEEKLKMEAIADRLESDCEIIFEELLLRKNNDFDATIDYLRMCEKMFD